MIEGELDMCLKCMYNCTFVQLWKWMGDFLLCWFILKLNNFIHWLVYSMGGAAQASIIETHNLIHVPHTICYACNTGIVLATAVPTTLIIAIGSHLYTIHTSIVFKQVLGYTSLNPFGNL